MAKKPKPLHIKVRVRLLRRMRRSEAVRKLHRAINTGIVPEGIELGFVDWRTGKGSTATGGQKIGTDALNALVEFHAAMVAAPHTRIAIVDDGKGEQ